MLISHPLVGLGREAEPATVRAMMVDDDIGDGSDSLCLESFYHAAELRLRTERGVLVEVIKRVIAHRLRCSRLAALRHPYKVEAAGEIVGFLLQHRPLGVVE